MRAGAIDETTQLAWGGAKTSIGKAVYATAADVAFARRITNPTPAMPTIIKNHVVGSGTPEIDHVC